MSTVDRIEALRSEAADAVAAAPTSDALEDLRVRYLGRKAELPNLLRTVASLDPEERAQVGKAANAARQALETLIAARAADPPPPVGRHHLLNATRREIEDVFIGLGFTVYEGPEVDLVYYNFDALNHDPAHPSRSRSDTF